MWAFIGGSGFEKFEQVEILEELSSSTPFGNTSEGFKRIRVQGQDCLFLPRHGSRHTLLPSEINARANIYALKKWGATKVVAFSAVGSLQHDLKPGDLVVPTQYLNQTKMRKNHTFAGEGVVGHVSLAHPVWSDGLRCLQEHAESFPFTLHFEKTYVAIEGPAFSTQAESHFYRIIGADIVGMTAFPEYALAREAGLCYLPCCFITDYDSWDNDLEHVTIQQVLDILRQNNHKAFHVVQLLLNQSPPEDESIRTNSLKHNLMSSLEHISTTQKEWLDVLGCEALDTESLQRF